MVSAVPAETGAAAALLMARVDERLTAVADPARATAMRAYMRDQFPFLGVPSPAVQQVLRAALAELPRPDAPTLREVALACWARPEREYQYLACVLLRRQVRVLDSGFVDTARYLITTKPWWDTVDALAAHVVGPLVARDPGLVTTMDAWAAGHELWLIRTAILHQLTYKAATDAPRLLRYCAAQAGHPDFFIRKAIGWALREYGRTDPAAVRAFVADHHGELSGLSRREALKHLS
ncbi:DNA alkylation repair protein [Catellatospora vulcania]|uniref:DNA alkylation repair protein n=1 Tax=Catellatospora vulcania TaxID=1460450 RepID=UPI001E303DB5|nr:DNA alkylation repair protein [Catellatospora vulcania]